ncbi:MAG: zinc ribbon domain-containing protein [Nitrososphaeria archaeon]
MPFCPKCGKEIQADVGFCPYCCQDLRVIPSPSKPMPQSMPRPETYPSAR